MTDDAPKMIQLITINNKIYFFVLKLYIGLS